MCMQSVLACSGLSAALDVQHATTRVMPQPADIRLVSVPIVVIVKFLYSFVSLALCHRLHSSLHMGRGSYDYEDTPARSGATSRYLIQLAAKASP